MDSRINHTSNCLLIAPLQNHATIGRVAALINTKYTLSVADVSGVEYERVFCYPFDRIAAIYDIDGVKNDPIYSVTSMNILLASFIDSLRSAKILLENRQISERLRDIVLAVKPSVVVTFYGPIGIHFARIIKRIDFKIPIINIINLIPSTIDLKQRRGINKCFFRLLNRECNDYRFWLPKLEGVVYASEEMKKFVERRHTGLRAMRLISPDYLPKTFQGSGNLNPSIMTGRGPNIIFLGAPERYGTVIDALDDEFLELCKSKIHIYSSNMSEEVLATGYGHIYSRMTNKQVFTGELAEFARQFDAVLIAYNINVRHERFISTLPTRFFTALTTGLPIVIKKGYFDACERYIEKHDIGFVYRDVIELVRFLRDHNRIFEIRQRAQRHMAESNAEARSKEWEEFIGQVIEKSKR